MKIGEYRLLEEAWERSFGFQLNRIWELYDLPGDPHSKANYQAKTLACDRAFSEFIVALEELGVELEEVEAPLHFKKSTPQPSH